MGEYTVFFRNWFRFSLSLMSVYCWLFGLYGDLWFPHLLQKLDVNERGGGSTRCQQGSSGTAGGMGARVICLHILVVVV